jgi:hypothetical protein
MIPSGRNWALSVVRPAMYWSCEMVAFCTKSAGSAFAMSAAECVLIQCNVATSASTTFWVASSWDLTQAARASRPAAGRSPPTLTPCFS